MTSIRAQLKIVLFVCLSVAASAGAQTAISISTPAGGEVYVFGQTQTVRLAGRFKTADLELSTDGGATFSKIGSLDNKTLSRDAQNTFPFAITGPSSTTCVIRVTITGVRTPIVVTSGMFSIVDRFSGGAAVVTGLSNGSVTNPILAAGAVTTDKISSGNSAAGTVLTADGSGKAAFSPVSGNTIASGQASLGMVLTANGSGSSAFSSIDGSQITGKVAQSASADLAANFSGSLGGDVTGLQNATVVGRLSGVPLASTAPMAGQILQYNGGTSRWEPTTLGSGPVTGITGTANQISAVNNAGNVKLTTPQDIATTSNVTFASVAAKSATISNSSGTPLSVSHTNNGVAATFSTNGSTAVTVFAAGTGPALESTSSTFDGMHALTLGTSTSGIFAESVANDSYGLYAMSNGTRGQGRAAMLVSYDRDGYAVEIQNRNSENTGSGGGGGLLVDTEGNVNNIAAFQSQKVNRIVFDNAGTGHFPKLTVGNAAIMSGTGIPNGSVAGNVGDMFLRTDGGAGSTLYIKESSSGTTSGWTAK